MRRLWCVAAVADSCGNTSRNMCYMIPAAVITAVAIALYNPMHRRSLLQFDPGFPWPTTDMWPTASQCNKTGNSAIELFYGSTWPTNTAGPYCFRIWTNPNISGEALGVISPPVVGQTDPSAFSAQLTALGFEVGEHLNCFCDVELMTRNGTETAAKEPHELCMECCCWCCKHGLHVFQHTAS